MGTVAGQLECSVLGAVWQGRGTHLRLAPQVPPPRPRLRTPGRIEYRLDLSRHGSPVRAPPRIPCSLVKRSLMPRSSMKASFAASARGGRRLVVRPAHQEAGPPCAWVLCLPPMRNGALNAQWHTGCSGSSQRNRCRSNTFLTAMTTTLFVPHRHSKLQNRTALPFAQPPSPLAAPPPACKTTAQFPAILVFKAHLGGHVAQAVPAACQSAFAVEAGTG